MIKLVKELDGKILDIGGGGEGIIGRLYMNQVIAIDNRQSELDETPEDLKKFLMDATALEFSDNYFEHVTSFFTLMFMNTEEQRRTIMEAGRVLKNGGKLHIWDCDITAAYPEPFCIDLVIELPDERVATTYGVGKIDVQNKNLIIKMCVDAGLTLIENSNGEDGFYLCFAKG